MPTDSIEAEDFAAFFRGVHGFDPYPWQDRLVRRVVGAASWPEVIDLPTGSGKTAVIDIGVFALAARPSDSPRRLVYVINRRTVVDQAYEHVLRLQSALEECGDPAVRRVANRLREVCGDAPINGIRLRGGIHGRGAWADRPDSAWVTVATVDQFGSRLLFRGYGSSPRMWPVQAGLAGNDCLVIVDEAHLSKPFVETLRQVRDMQPEMAGMPRRYQVVEMSATPASDAEDRLRLEADDMVCDELAGRVQALKTALLREIDWANPDETIPAAVLGTIDELEECERTVGVVVNRVRSARETYRALVEPLAAAGFTLHLLTGRMRPLDRDNAVATVQPAVNPSRAIGSTDRTVVVATQCIEAGADYSFDAMVTEVAPIDSLRQRFGRLDRRGTLSTAAGRPARAWILGPARPEASTDFENDPVYGGAVAATWAELLGRTTRGRFGIDVSPTALDDFPETAYVRKLDGPLLLPHHMDAWAQTNPAPAQETSIERFLHGMLPDSEAHQPADVNLVWRYDRSLAALREVPIRAVEKLSVPWRAAVAWLGSGRESDVSDAGNERVGTSGASARDGQTSEDWCRWMGHDAPPEPISARDVRPGDVLLVDPARGGLLHGTWSPASAEAVVDLGDAAQHAHQRRFTLRLDPQLHPGLRPPPKPFQEAGNSGREAIDRWLRAAASVPEQPAWMAEVLEKVMSPARRVRTVGTGDTAYFVVSAGVRSEVDTMDGSDAMQSGTGAGVSLRRHLSGVGSRVREYAERVGLSTELCSDLELAARLHDVGKADRRFQRQMVGGDEVRLESLDEPLAKSLPQAYTDPDEWPPIYHELMSVAMVRDSEVLDSAHDSDLVLHLVGNHHGRARALPLLRPDNDPQSVVYTDGGHCYRAESADAGPKLASEMAERFWRLAERYGHHGLAWMEAILRQADQQESVHERNSV